MMGRETMQCREMMRMKCVAAAECVVAEVVGHIGEPFTSAESNSRREVLGRESIARPYA